MTPDRSKMINSDRGAARTIVWFEVALAAVTYKLLNELFFWFIQLTLIDGDTLYVELALSYTSLHNLSCCWFLVY